jgi:hypothetical protein
LVISRREVLIATSRFVSRAQRSTAWWCAADPGPRFL